MGCDRIAELALKGHQSRMVCCLTTKTAKDTEMVALGVENNSDNTPRKVKMLSNSNPSSNEAPLD